ncbi:hypothetical protein evm_010212 [Chilo suppressalis]|nr:hypothetical protein evm_010212 [Chilo suppressalis]
MAAITPRRSTRIPHTHTPKMTERKKGLFQGNCDPTRDSLTKHRHLPVVNSESDSDDCDLGIISTLDSSSGEDNDVGTPKKINRSLWPETRGQQNKLLKESQDLKNFIKSPFTLKKYQTRYSCPDGKCSGSASTPVTPRFHNHPSTPSSTHSCTSVHTTSSTSSRARKSLASLIADTESCSSSLKDLNFDTDSGTDSKENTPSKGVRRSLRKLKTPQFNSFKGVLVEQQKNMSPMKTAVVCLTKMDMSTLISPTQMLKTPHNTIESNHSPPKLGHNRRSVVEIEESPESVCNSEKSQKRLRNDSMTETGPHSKYPRLDNTVPKARISLFNSNRLKEILSAKSFYGKSNPELNTNISSKISKAIEVTNTYHRRPFRHSNSHRRKRNMGQINMGVRHKIRKPKIHKGNVIHMKNGSSHNNTLNSSALNNSTMSNTGANDTTVNSQNSTQEFDKPDPFDNENQTIAALLSQWTEEDIPESELSISKPKPNLPCFNSTVIEETNPIFQPVVATPVPIQNIPQDKEAVIIELGCGNSAQINETTVPQEVVQDVDMTEPESHKESHGEIPKSGQFLPVEGGYIFVGDNGAPVSGQEELPDLDEIERELRMLDEQILQMAQSNNINAEAVLASTETLPAPLATDVPSTSSATEQPQKLFPIFSNPNTGSTPTSKGSSDKAKKPLLKNGSDQYVIDAGQKRFGATQCTECGAIYQVGDPQDEHDHLVHHNATDVLKFNGWKDEFVVERWGFGRCLRIRGGENGWKKVESLLSRVIHPHLGYGENLPSNNLRAYTAYLYIEKKQIIGCLVVEPKVKAYKLIPGDPDCCSVEEYPVKCGISRLWVHINHRRRGIAGRLLDCARASFLYGTALKLTDIAFSAPTLNGKAFAAKYCGTENFYVYLD